jgi:DNA-binding HxlR family transcriptional regulator
MGDMKLMTSEIINALNRGGAMEFDELFKAVSKMQGDLDEKALESHLMGMEIQGLVRVSKMARGKRRIELA